MQSSDGSFAFPILAPHTLPLSGVGSSKLLRSISMRCTLLRRAGFLQNLKPEKNNFFTNLWNKPRTRDESIKSYVPDVIEEGLREQRAVLQENTARDVVVELGYKVLSEIECKRPTPSIAPHLNKILTQYGYKDLIAQRPLSYLLYPCSTINTGHQPHELVLNFTENFRSFVEEVERNGCSLRNKNQNKEEQTAESGKVSTVPTPDVNGADAIPSDMTSDTLKSGPVIMASADKHEPMGVTLFIRILSGMSIANVQSGDLASAVRCVDAGLEYVVEPSRRGALLGMKSGILVRQRKYEEAVECAMEAVQVSGNIQGYIQGAFAMHMLHRLEEAVKFLERGREDHPMNTQLLDLMDKAVKELEQQPVVEETAKITS
uniref:WGS project CAEQ00000000 data, annotated contig 986 n=1 Tax=Trypanosoma congolense (strain IL3000) TaxID=1068625 RepID=F9WK52_TRYCI|nr:unnamed protein product [Trypanosoma congolense IL3000]